MKRFGLLIIVLAALMLPVALGGTVAGPVIPGIILSGNETMQLNGMSYLVTGGLNLVGNSSLTLINASITFTDIESTAYTISGNSRLTAINSSIIWEGPYSLQASQYASIELINVELISTFEVNNQSYYNVGMGLKDSSNIIARDLTVGFIRLADNAHCSVNDSIIGNFGTRSTGEVEFNNCAIESLTLYYENSRVQVNQTTTGKQGIFTQSQFVREGEESFDFKMINCTILNPPKIIIVDGILEAKDTTLGAVYTAGDSAIEATNTEIYEVLAIEFCWMIFEDSQIDYLNAMRGDFNIQLTNTTHQQIYTLDTVGLNLITKGAQIDQLILDEAIENMPQNVELQETTIEDLYITMGGPQPIQCDNVTIGNLTIVSGRGNEPPITFTGTIHFKPEAEANQQTKEGYTCIRRVYLIEATIDDQPAADTEITIHLEDSVKKVTTNQQGQAVFPVTYLYQFSLVSNPQPGGPYLISYDNLTEPITITLNGENYELNLLSDTPVRLVATSGNEAQRWEPDLNQYQAAAIVLAILAIIVYLFNSRRREQRQI